jgi:hypothetical protein
MLKERAGEGGRAYSGAARVDEELEAFGKEFDGADNVAHHADV